MISGFSLSLWLLVARLGFLLRAHVTKIFHLGVSRRTWSEVGAGGVPGVRLTPARLSWSQLPGVGVNLESALGRTGANLESVALRSWSQLRGDMREIFFAQVQSFPVKSSLDLTGLDRTWQVHSFRPSPALLAQVQVFLAQVQHFWLKSSTFQPSPGVLGQVQVFWAKSRCLRPSPGAFAQIRAFSLRFLSFPPKSSLFCPSPAPNPKSST